MNPQIPAKSFLSGDANDEGGIHMQGQLSFSHNSVTLQISGPDVADLSFCDLPGAYLYAAFGTWIALLIYCVGLIASVSSNRGSGDDIALVQSLVTAYIKKPSCIILLTVACESESRL